MNGASSGAAMPGQRPAHLGLDVVKPTTDDGPDPTSTCHATGGLTSYSGLSG